MSAVFEQYHLTVKRDGDTFTLRQVDHSGNEEGVVLHTSQIRYLAEVAGLLPTAPALLAVPAADGEAMHSLSVDTCGGDTIWIEQTRMSGNGGTDGAIELHPSQAAWLASRLQQIVGHGEARELATLRRRMLALYRKLIDLAGHFAWDDLFERSSFADDLFNDVNLAAELANEFVADLMGVTKEIENDDGQRNENPQAISVTDSGETRKPGRPATGEAMSNAERQSKHRAKHKESAPQQAELGGL
jgi:hypothetical protein